jgi:cytochrome P450
MWNGIAAGGARLIQIRKRRSTGCERQIGEIIDDRAGRLCRFYTRGAKSLSHLCSGRVFGESWCSSTEGEMSDLLMIVLVAGAFAAAVAYAGLCQRLARRPELPDEGPR